MDRLPAIASLLGPARAALCAVALAPVSSAVSADSHPAPLRLAQGTTDARSPTLAPPGSVVSRPVYVPPTRGAPAVRIVAGTRGAGSGPRLALFAPDHTGHTTEERPRLYWYAYRPIDEPVAVMVVDDTAIDPLLEKSIAPPLAAGFHVLDLDAEGVALAADREYLWSVAIVHDPEQRSRDTYAEGSITRVRPPGEVRDALGRASPDERPSVLAGAGLWYDAVDAVSRRIAAGDGEPWPDVRGALLDQVGIPLPEGAPGD